MHQSAYVTSCPFTQLYKIRGGPPEGKLCPIPPPKAVFQMWGLDHLGPFKLSKKGNVHIIVAIDYLSKWVEEAAVPSTAAGPVINFLEILHAFPERIVNDRETAFGSQDFRNPSHTDWDVKLDAALFAINSSKQSTSQLSPYELVYRRSPSTPLDFQFNGSLKSWARKRSILIECGDGGRFQDNLSSKGKRK